jgi:hypothetical protein
MSCLLNLLAWILYKVVIINMRIDFVSKHKILWRMNEEKWELRFIKHNIYGSGLFHESSLQVSSEFVFLISNQHLTFSKLQNLPTAS